jgi:hypothetical protein
MGSQAEPTPYEWRASMLAGRRCFLRACSASQFLFDGNDRAKQCLHSGKRHINIKFWPLLNRNGDGLWAGVLL